jgi:AcrR family transcriptional regulator
MGLIGDEGLDSFSMHKLADALDLTVGAIYRYFPSKSALIAALEQRVIDSLGDELRSADREVREDKASLAANPLLLLIRLAVVYRRRFKSHPQQMRLIGNLLATPDPVLGPDEADKVIGSMLETLETVRLAFRDAAEGGALVQGDPLERAIINWATLRGVIQISKLGGHRPDLFAPDRLYRGTLDGLLLGWGADPEKLDAAWTQIENEHESEVRT